MSLPVVYNRLATLAHEAIIRRILCRIASSLRGPVGDNHHHSAVECANGMVDVGCVVGQAPCPTAEDDSGYEIDAAKVISWGGCADWVVVAAASSGGGCRAAERA